MADAGMLAVVHARHDGVLIASTVDRRLTTPSSLAQALLAACTECVRLHADLRAVAAALPSAATPRRTREFTLSAADSERLRPRGLTRWLRLIGSSRDTLTRPLAIGFTTLGLVGLLVASVPGALPGGGGTAAAASSAAPQIEMDGAASRDGGVQQMAPEPGDAAARVPPAREGIPPVIVLSSVFLVTGGGLFAARRIAPGGRGRRGTVR